MLTTRGGTTARAAARDDRPDPLPTNAFMSSSPAGRHGALTRHGRVSAHSTPQGPARGNPARPGRRTRGSRPAPCEVDSRRVERELVRALRVAVDLELEGVLAGLERLQVEAARHESP